MRILFIGNLNYYARGYQRYRAMFDLKHEVFGITTVPRGRVHGKSSPPGFYARFRAKIGFPVDETNVNEKIIRSVDDNIDMVWIEKGLMIKPRTLRIVKNIFPQVKLVLWAEEYVAPNCNRSIYYSRCIPLYDLIFTPRSQNLGKKGLPAFNAKKIIFVDESYGKYSHRPLSVSSKDKERLGAEVIFIGTFERDRAEKMLYLAENGIPVRVWGNGWDNWVNCHSNLRVENKPLYGDDYARALCASKICLCFLRKANLDRQTNRTMEIPACGAFMLGERTDEHLRLFEEGKEAEFFSSKEELLEKVEYYLENDKERKKIAKAGRERCLKSGYSHHDRLKYMLKKIEKL